MKILKGLEGSWIKKGRDGKGYWKGTKMIGG
jgi:hypothetical protein